MLYIYRPYLDNLKVAECLHETDCHLMKNNSYLLIKVLINRINGGTPMTIEKGDPFVKHYWNNGEPCLDFLFDYYYSIYHLCTMQSGDMVDYAKGLEEQCSNLNKSGDCWTEKMCEQHRMFLLKHDWFWYKRHFRDLFEYEIADLKLFDNKGEPAELDKKKLKARTI